VRGAPLPSAPESPPPAIPRLGRRACLAIFFLALALRLAAVFATGPATSSFGDARAYVFAARTLVETGTYPDATDFRFFFRPPVYPVFLAVATLGHPDSVPRARAATAVAGSLVPLLLAALSARIFRRRGVAIASGLLAAVHPPFVLASSEIQSEPLFTLLLLAAGFLLLAAADRPSSNLAVLAGAALGLAALTRSTGLALAPLLLAPLLDRRWPGRARAHLGGSALLGFAIALSPWIARNAVVFHELILSSDAGGFALYSGNTRWTRQYYELRNRDQYFAWQSDLDRDVRQRLEELERRAGRRLSPHERSAGFRDLAIAEVRADPAAAIRLLLTKAWHWIRPYPTPWFWSAKIVAATTAIYVALFVLAVRGIALAERRGIAQFCFGVLALSMAVHVVVIVVWRYRMAYWDPILILYAVPGALPRPTVR
jgi:4-amino-4-deoxy-L-arabinose transferase-like glycosyltransferase